MALNNTERVGRGLDELTAGLVPFIERELRARVGPYCHLPAGSHVAKGTTTGSFYTASTD